MNSPIRSHIRIVDLLNPAIEIKRTETTVPILFNQTAANSRSYQPKVIKVLRLSPVQYLTPPLSPLARQRNSSDDMAMTLLTKAALASSDDDNVSTSQESLRQSSANGDERMKLKFTRKRRKFHEVFRKFVCGYNGCKKAYGYLNHLNFHIEKVGHGEKRLRERGSRQDKDDRVRNVYL